MAKDFPYPLHDAMVLLGWIGTPRVVYKGRLIDGRERSTIAISLGMRLEPLTKLVTTRRDAARLLIAAGHYHRAASLKLFPFDPKDFSSCLAWAGMPKPRQALPGKSQHLPKIRKDAIDAMLASLERAEERGDESIPLADVRAILARWIV
jgi:hypothetical protein